MKKPKTYTLTEAAKKLGVSRAAVHKAILDKRLRAKWGKTIKTIVQATEGWTITEEAIQAYEVSVSQQERGKKK